MSITDEGTRPSSEPNVQKDPENTSSGQNGSGQPGTGLPGLAAFGQMPGYAPVSGQQPEAEDPADDHQENYAQDYSHEPQDYSEHAEPDYSAAGIDDTGTGSAYADDDIHAYMAEQHAAQDDGVHLADAALQSESAYHGEAGQSLQTFEAHYDQHPEIPLSSFDDPGEAQAEQPFFHEQGQMGDADFLGGENAPDIAEPSERRGRKILMAASGLIGVLALGGALAFAYKIGGDSDIASAGKPPLIQADSRPVKMAPDKPGGKQFPHKNKKIYERLQGADSKEVEKIVPRQEDVAAAATAAVTGSQPGQAAADQKTPETNKSAPAGAPRKVKTLTVRPDGTIEAPDTKQKVVKAPAAPSPAAGAASDGTVAMTFPRPASNAPPKPAAAAPAPVTPTIPKPAVVTPPPAQPEAAAKQKVAAAQPPAAASAEAAPPPVQKPPVPRAAAPQPQHTASAPAPAAASAGNYVVQVAARKSQTDALAAFADIQQKYPRLLDGYRPIIKRADLGEKGVWYRLNVGPVESKQVASSLCGQLKSAGMRSCLVRAQ